MCEGIGLFVLNLIRSEGGSVDVRGRRLVVNFKPPFARALAGRLARNSRVDLEAAENGLNLAVTSVMNLVIMFADSGDVNKSGLKDSGI